jgi:hypothetical protein
MKFGRAILFSALVSCFMTFLFTIQVPDAFCANYTINFGASSFSPSSLNVKVGDVISFVGDFYTHIIQSTSVPAGAASFGPTNYYTTSLSYTVAVAGTYNFEDNIDYYYGSFTATDVVKGLTLSTTSLDFGNVRVTGSLIKTDTVKSVGPDAPLTISSSPLTTGTSFTTSPSSINRVINVGSYEVETVTFKPTARGSFTDVLTINSNATNAGDQAKTINLSGNGINGIFSGAATLAFNKIRVGTPEQLSYTITNSGDDTLFLSPPSSILGAGFTIVSEPANTSIPPNGTGSIVIGFLPTSRQAFTGSLQMKAQYNVTVPLISLSGTGIAPILAVPSQVDLGAALVGAVLPGSVQITNNGDDTLHVSSVSFTQQGTKFTLSTTGAFTVLPGTTGAVNFNYTSSTESTDNALLTINSDDLNSATKSVSITARSGLPRMSVTTKDTINFGSVRIGATGIAPLTIKNNGTYDLTVQVGPFSPSQFSLGGVTSPIPSQSSTDAIVQFTPTSEGLVTGMGIIQGNDQNNPVDTFFMQGIGVNSALDIPSSVDFHGLNLAKTRDTVLTLRNLGSGTAKIFSYKLIDSNNGFMLIDTIAHSITAKDSITIKLRFAPTQEISYTAALILNTDDASASRKILLLGKGINSKLSLDNSSIDFGTLDTGIAVTKKFMITNIGTASTSVMSVKISGDPSFTLDNVSTPIPLAPAASTDIAVTFNPITAGTFTGTVTVSGTDGSPISVSLQGKGKITVITKSVNPFAEEFGLHLKFQPNPMNSLGTIKIILSKPSELDLTLYDGAGRLIRTIGRTWFNEGENSLPFEGGSLPSGEYYIHALINGSSAAQEKIVIVH